MKTKARLTLPVLQKRWSACTKCEIGIHAKHHVSHEFYPKPNGKLSSELGLLWTESREADIMIVGIGPGLVENSEGKPFCGPSGILLRFALANAMQYAPLRVVITNLVACRPYALKPTGVSNRDPSKQEIANCSPRLVSLIQLTKPELIICCGDLPSKHIEAIIERSGVKVEHVSIEHPSFILRVGTWGSHDRYVSKVQALFVEAFKYRRRSLPRGNIITGARQTEEEPEFSPTEYE